MVVTMEMKRYSNLVSFVIKGCHPSGEEKNISFTGLPASSPSQPLNSWICHSATPLRPLRDHFIVPKSHDCLHYTDRVIHWMPLLVPKIRSPA